jgi:hypothetical protein
MIHDLNINDFNLDDRNNYVMLAPHYSLTKTTRKKLKIVPLPGIKEILRSTIHNVMKIPQ